jgi:hypothetical protein
MRAGCDACDLMKTDLLHSREMVEPVHGLML